MKNRDNLMRSVSRDSEVGRRHKMETRVQTLEDKVKELEYKARVLADLIERVDRVCPP